MRTEEEETCEDWGRCGVMREVVRNKREGDVTCGRGLTYEELGEGVVMCRKGVNIWISCTI